MKRNLFINLFKYRPNDFMTPEENFITESFVYLLQDSLDNNKLLFKDFINFIGITEIRNYKSIILTTQTVFETNNTKKRAIPDIYLFIDGIHIFIEVKFSAHLNTDQIMLYQEIKTNPKNIFTLTKYTIEYPENCSDFKKSILWSEIYDLVKNNSPNYSNNFLINNFLQFMEELKMNTPKVSYELSKGVPEIDNLLMQLERVILELKIPKSNSFGRNGFGYNLFQSKVDDKGQISRNLENPSKYYAWTGMKFSNSASLIFQIWDNAVIKHLRSNHSPDFLYVKESQVYETNEFNFEKEVFFDKSPESQISILKKWLNQNMTLLQSLYDKINNK